MPAAAAPAASIRPAAPAAARAAVLRRCACGGSAQRDGECEGCRRKRLGLQRAAAAPAPAVAPPVVHDVLAAPGRPLDAGTRAALEPRFGHSFAHVRVHDDARAAESARSVAAHAYTVGRDVVFGAGEYAPHTPRGRGLLAHELAHVVQQRGDPAPVGGEIEVGGDDAHEREAREAAARLGAGAAAGVSAGGDAPRLRRVEHGTFVSTVGASGGTNPGDPFLAHATGYYRQWGFPNVRRVGTMQEVLAQLAQVTAPTLDRFRIVSHAAPTGIALGLTPDFRKEWFDATAAQFTTAGRFRQEMSERALISSDPVALQLLDAVRGQPAMAAHLATAGIATAAGAAPPAWDSPLGIALRAILEGAYLDVAQLDTGGPAQFADRAVLNAFNQLRYTTYRDEVLAAAPQASRQGLRQALDALRAGAAGALRSAGTTIQVTQADAAGLAIAYRAGGAGPAALDPGIGTVAREGRAAGGTYRTALDRVRAKVTAATHVEIRGCNAGADRAFLTAVQAYFGTPGNLPTVSAPDLYQYFSQGWDWQSFNTSPADVAALDTAWSSGLSARFDRWSRLQGGEMVMAPRNGVALADLLTQYGVATAAAEVARMNPEIADVTSIPMGTVVWLRARRFPTSGFTSLADFCRSFLRGRVTVQDMHGFNPTLPAPQLPAGAAAGAQPDVTLTGSERLWSVDAAVRTAAGTASAARTRQDFETHLRGGSAFMYGNRLGGTSMFQDMMVDESTRSASMLGWVGAQRFGPTPRPPGTFSGNNQAVQAGVSGTHIQYLSYESPPVADPIFPSDPRFNRHIIVLPGVGAPAAPASPAGSPAPQPQQGGGNAPTP